MLQYHVHGGSREHLADLAPPTTKFDACKTWSSLLIPTNLKDKERVGQSQSLFERTSRAGQRTTVVYPLSSALTSLQTFCRNKPLGSSWSFEVLESDCHFLPLIFIDIPRSASCALLVGWGCFPAPSIIDLFSRHHFGASSHLLTLIFILSHDWT